MALLSGHLQHQTSVTSAESAVAPLSLARQAGWERREVAGHEHCESLAA
jgi:hypothetical protein